MTAVCARGAWRRGWWLARRWWVYGPLRWRLYLATRYVQLRRGLVERGLPPPGRLVLPAAVLMLAVLLIVYARPAGP